MVQEVDRIELPDGSIYRGQVIKGTQIRHGRGIQEYPDGARYEGEWKNNKVEGRGTFYHVNGDVFDGQFVADKACGIGTYTYVTGQIYSGQWVDDI